MSTQPTLPREAFSPDGYIISQENTAAMRYGSHGSHWNGCGWIAAFNLLKALGMAKPPAEVRDGMLPGQWLGGSLGTGPFRLRRYLRRCGVMVQTAYTRKKAAMLAQNRKAGIVLFWDKKYLHYVTFVRDGQGLRFLNAIDGHAAHYTDMKTFLQQFARGPAMVMAA